MKLLVIDNYDSFTFNLIELIRNCSPVEFEVFYNDKIEVIQAANYDKILISPGPGLPDKAGVSCEIIKKLAPVKNILGICLGHQAIATVFGGSLFNLNEVSHGKVGVMTVLDRNNPLFINIPDTFSAGLYHSWAVSKNHLPSCLIPIAESETNTIMGIRHHAYNVYGLQFHPESVMTPLGKSILLNWLNS